MEGYEMAGKHRKTVIDKETQVNSEASGCLD
jgi:hypothetical protein